jgi:peptide chain release factor 2
MAAPGFWDEPERAQKILVELKSTKRVLDAFKGLDREVTDSEGLVGLLEAEPDDSMALDLDRQTERLLPRIQQLELKSLLAEESDAHGAIVTIHPGAGGTESQDWAQMLYRMYVRYAERSGFTVGLLDLQPGEEAGIKDATIQVDGEYAYGFLKAEHGIHRLVRISPFDAQKRRHTSFASVFVTPEIEDDIEIVIPDKDIRVDTYRSSGAGGQHVNVTDSAVRITHIPTNIVVTCQNERSQGRNRDVAMKVLRAKLYQKALEERQAEESKRAGAKKKIEWGSQIRSYVLHPYRMIKDHRTDFEMGDTDRVLDGDLTPFIDAYLKESASEKRASAG